MRLTYGYTPPVPSYDSPNVQIRDAIVNPNIPNRWIPGPTTYADFASIAGLIPGTLPGFVTIVVGGDLGPGGESRFPRESGRGALTMVWRNFPAFPTAGMRPLGTANEPAAGARTPRPAIRASSSRPAWWWSSQSRILVGVLLVLALREFGDPTGPQRHARLVVGVDPRRGSQSGAPRDTDGRRPRRHQPESWGCDLVQRQLKEGNPAPGALGTTWFVPFVLHSGCLATGTNPPTEPWSTGAFAADNTPLRKWADDFCGITTLCPSPGTGAVLNPPTPPMGCGWASTFPTI